MIEHDKKPNEFRNLNSELALLKAAWFLGLKVDTKIKRLMLFGFVQCKIKDFIESTMQVHKQTNYWKSHSNGYFSLTENGYNRMIKEFNKLPYTFYKPIKYTFTRYEFYKNYQITIDKYGYSSPNNIKISSLIDELKNYGVHFSSPDTANTSRLNSWIIQGDYSWEMEFTTEPNPDRYEEYVELLFGSEKTKETDKKEQIKKQKKENKFNESYIEGEKKYKLHLIKERNKKLITEAKQKYFDENKGIIKCEICEFSFNETYGDRGFGYIEGHHKVPLSDLTEKHKTEIHEIAMVCANCHRIIHRKKPLLTITEMKKIINDNKKSH